MDRSSVESGSINANDTHIIDDYVKGSRGEKGQLSPVRRFFCLYVTFDLLFTTLMWLICIVLSGQEIFWAFKLEIAKYTVKTSLFDTVMLAAGRFVVLLLCYALFHLNHWWAVALTTAASSGMLIAKVFLFEWDNTRNTIFVVLLILISFLLSWGEAWFLDFRVFPRELKAKLIEEKLNRYSETSPLLGSSHVCTEGERDDRTFYSPIQSPSGSEAEDEIHEDLASSQRLDAEGFRYKLCGKQSLELGLRILQSEGWKPVKSTPEGDATYLKPDPKSKGSVFKLNAIVNANLCQLMQIIWHRSEDAPKWNPAVTYCKILRKIDSHTEVSYHVTAEAGAGLITSRDFVTLRHWETKGNACAISAVSIEYPQMPPQATYVRGEHGPCVIVVTPKQDNQNQCTVRWLLSIDLKVKLGWIPQYLIDQAVASTMLDFVKNLRKHLSE